MWYPSSGVQYDLDITRYKGGVRSYFQESNPKSKFSMKSFVLFGVLFLEGKDYFRDSNPKSNFSMRSFNLEGVEEESIQTENSLPASMNC